MERENAWKSYSDKDLDKLEKLSSDYIEFISENKTERECVNASITMAEKAGYKPLAKAIKKQRKLKAGDKVYAQTHGKALILAVLGTDPLEDGFNILGAHIDSPRLDAKQTRSTRTPISRYLTRITTVASRSTSGSRSRWPIHGVIALKAGRSIEVRVGEDPSDPVFCISDLLPHLGQKQVEKNAKEVIDAEDLDVIVGSRPLLFEKDKLNDDSPAWEKVAEKEPVKASVLKYLAEYYGIEEEDFLSAELEIVPAGRAREMGFDRSMVIGYGQDDRVCAYTSLGRPARHRESQAHRRHRAGRQGGDRFRGRYGHGVAVLREHHRRDHGARRRGRAAQAASRARRMQDAVLRRLRRARPLLCERLRAQERRLHGRGLVFNKYTGARGKSGSNDTSAEFVAEVRKVMDDAGVAFQTAELGRVDIGGGGTIAYIPAKYDMDVIDSGVAVLSMHAPWEITSKADIYEARQGLAKAFLKNA